MRIFIALLDGVGVGELPDASQYGDQGSHTLRNTSQAVGGLRLPNLEALGLGCIDSIEGVAPVPNPKGYYGKMRERSAGKDTLTGHWEIAGIILDKPFPVYPRGFPPEVVQRIEEAIGRPILGNKPASGTAIIEELGAEHLRTGYPIVYTSADSVLQIAAHEEIIPPPQLYEMCRKVREIMTGEHAVARVIARPFVGSPGKFVRTPRRKDFSLPPPSQTVLDALVASGKEVIGVGKIGEIFAFRGLSDSIKTADNADTFRVFLKLQKSGRGDLIWANFNDFDTLYGHRNNPQGFAQALQDWDATLTDFLASMREEDLLIITSDHGCDPTTPSTDHSREYALLLVYSPSNQRGRSLGVRDTFCDVAHSIAEFLGVKWHGPGTSFASEILS
ncbi:phosphopentomutase [Thermatribacter velox]|uniref:Phosphopentomutase n=1 Tax=Thermatribacter velox TaxID=3039681 RepID=A0ABZ2YCA5_9BACT|nr:phosphopentomutase [Candidatus Atribacteria bacterium]